MKLAVAKIGANITFSTGNSSAANADILYFLRQLDIGEHDITIVTHHTRNTLIPKRMKFLEIATLEVNDLKGFDALLVFNGSINFFGGVCDPNLLALYSFMNKTDLPIVYVNTDGQLPFKQLWPLIWKRTWAANLNELDYYVPPEQVCYLTQFRDLRKVDYLIRHQSACVQTREFYHYPIAQTIFAKREKYFKPNPVPWNDRPYNLVFGGATRNTHKRKRIEHYYNLKTALLFGNLRGVKTPKATTQGKCSYQHFIKMMMKGKATVIIGDEFYENNNFSLRYYESLLADCVTFIDRRMDEELIFYGGVASSWLYITSPMQIKDVLNDPYVYEDWLDCKNMVFNRYNEDQQRVILVETIKQCADLT